MLGKRKQERTFNKTQQSKYKREKETDSLSSKRIGYNKYVLSRERKFYDVNLGAGAIPTTGTLILVFSPSLGNDYNNRIGRKCLLRSIYIRGYLNIDATNPLATANVGSQQTRMILFMDNQPNGIAPAITDLLVTNEVQSQLNPNNRDRFVVIKDKNYVFDPFIYNTATGYVGFNRTRYAIKIYKKMKCEVIFNQNSGYNINSITSCAIWLLFITTNNNGSEQNVSIRNRYDDS